MQKKANSLYKLLISFQVIARGMGPRKARGPNCALKALNISFIKDEW